jgi:hypothetical protein
MPFLQDSLGSVPGIDMPVQRGLGDREGLTNLGNLERIWQLTWG